jgi:hypothetical protein
MLTLNQLLHPLHTAAAARARVDAHLELRRLTECSERSYAADPRYDLENVTRGFSPSHPPPRPFDFSHETALLQRIRTAYRKAVEDQPFQSVVYYPAGLWPQARTDSFQPVIQALQSGDLETLRYAYRNFYRDSCSTGLVDLPHGMAQAFTGASIDDLHRRFYLGDALHRIDYWTAQVGEGFQLADLAGPGIGNPFGVVIDETLIPAGAPYQHYCAQRILEQLSSRAAVVAEIGGGYGGMAYYLLRNRLQLTYLDFDVPERLALATYYLMSACPSLTFLLYGEEELTAEVIRRADILLMPLFELPRLPSNSIDVSFSSHVFTDLSNKSLIEYLSVLSWSTKNCFLEIGDNETVHSIFEAILHAQLPLRLVETRFSDWDKYRSSRPAGTECLFRCRQ